MRLDSERQGGRPSPRTTAYYRVPTCAVVHSLFEREGPPAAVQSSQCPRVLVGQTEVKDLHESRELDKRGPSEPVTLAVQLRETRVGTEPEGTGTR